MQKASWAAMVHPIKWLPCKQYIFNSTTALYDDAPYLKLHNIPKSFHLVQVDSSLSHHVQRPHFPCTPNCPQSRNSTLLVPFTSEVGAHLPQLHSRDYRASSSSSCHNRTALQWISTDARSPSHWWIPQWCACRGPDHHSTNQPARELNLTEQPLDLVVRQAQLSAWRFS